MSTFRENVKVVILRRFIYSARANIYSARLKEHGIPCFISNINTSTLIPFGEGGILLHVRENDLEAAHALLEELDKLEKTPPDIDYRDADLQDIAYEKAVFERDQRIKQASGNIFWIILVAVIFLALIYSALNGRLF